MTDNLEIVEQAEILPVDEPQGEPENDVLPKATVSKIIERERQKAYEKGKREAMMELEQQQAPVQAEQQPMQQQAQQPSSLGGMQQLSQADIERMITERAPQALQAHVQQLQQKQMVDTFVNKMQAAEAKYPGLEADLNNLNYNDPRMHDFIALANQMENTGDIMKEVLDNPTKMESLMNMAYSQPHLAQKALMKLSESIKTNQQALAEDAQARDPISQIKPSQNANMDNGAMSVNDFRKMFRG